MKSKLLVSIVLSVTFILMTASSYYDYFSLSHEREYRFQNFEGIRLGGAFKVEIRQAEEFSVTAKGKKENLENLQFEVVNGILIASCSPGNSSSQETILEITMPVLKSADLHGATSSIITGFSEGSENINLRISGTSRVVTDVDCNVLDFKIEGDSVLVFKEHLKDSESAIKRSSRLLGRGGNCEYSYHRVGWI